MKKVLTVLAILVVLTSAIFAAETHKIKINAETTEVVPAFQLKVVKVGGDVFTNSGAASFSNDATVEQTSETTPRYVNDTVAATINFESASSVVVYAYLVNNAKTKLDYKIDFSDGIFRTVTRNGVVADGTTGKEYVEPSSVAVSANSEIPATQGVTAKGSGNYATVELEFTGKTCTASAAAGLLLATATFNYDAHTDIDPDTYSAYVTMTVAVNN